MSVPVVGVTTRKSGWRLLPEIPATRFSVSGSLRPKLGLLILLVILIVSTALILVPFVTSRLDPPSPPPHLGLNLHKFLSSDSQLREQKNFVSSPLLVSLSLISLIAVTRGESRRQLKRLLVSGDPGVGVDRYRNVTVGVYNQLYVDKSWDLDKNKQLIQEDFSKPNQARSNINARLKKATSRNMVEVELGGLRENMDMAVISAFDLKTKWKGGGGKSGVGSFHVSKDEQVKVPMWTHRGLTKSVEGLDSVVVVLPLDSGISLAVLLPNEVDNLQKVEQKLESLDLKSLNRLSGDEVNVLMPSVSTETELDLADFFKAQGVTEVFNEALIDTSISKMHGFALNKVIHKVRVNITEGDDGSPTNVGIRDKIKTVPCNRPFVFLIFDNSTGDILFVGRVVNPAKH